MKVLTEVFDDPTTCAKGGKSCQHLQDYTYAGARGFRLGRTLLWCGLFREPLEDTNTDGTGSVIPCDQCRRERT